MFDNKLRNTAVTIALLQSAALTPSALTEEQISPFDGKSFSPEILDRRLLLLEGNITALRDSLVAVNATSLENSNSIVILKSDSASTKTFLEQQQAALIDHRTRKIMNSLRDALNNERGLLADELASQVLGGHPVEIDQSELLILVAVRGAFKTFENSPNATAALVYTLTQSLDLPKDLKNTLIADSYELASTGGGVKLKSGFSKGKFTKDLIDAVKKNREGTPLNDIAKDQLREELTEKVFTSLFLTVAEFKCSQEAILDGVTEIGGTLLVHTIVSVLPLRYEEKKKAFDKIISRYSEIEQQFQNEFMVECRQGGHYYEFMDFLTKEIINAVESAKEIFEDSDYTDGAPGFDKDGRLIRPGGSPEKKKDTPNKEKSKPEPGPKPKPTSRPEPVTKPVPERPSPGPSPEPPSPGA